MNSKALLLTFCTGTFLFAASARAIIGPPGKTKSAGSDIKAASQIIGHSTPTSGTQHAFFYNDGVMTDLGTLGDSFSAGSGINAAGQIIGYSTIANDVQHAFAYDTQHAIVHDNGSMTGLNTQIDPSDPTDPSSGGPLSQSYGISGNGLITDYGSFGSGASALLLMPTVPEPETWGLMLMALSAVGVMVKRRKAAIPHI